MKMFYSGDDFSRDTPTPEKVLDRPCIMLTFWHLFNKKKMSRLERHFKRKKEEAVK